MEFTTFDPGAKVRGANVKATLEALEDVPAYGRELATSHGLNPDTLTEEKLVPVQDWLDALRDIQARVGEPALRDTGTRIVLNAEFPPQYPTVESILLALNDIYAHNHEGDVGHYRTELREDGAVVIRCETPYPRNFERGLVEGICRNRRAGGTIYCVEYEDGPHDSDHTCTLVVHRA